MRKHNSNSILDWALANESKSSQVWESREKKSLKPDNRQLYGWLVCEKCGKLFWVRCVRCSCCYDCTAQVSVSVDVGNWINVYRVLVLQGLIFFSVVCFVAFRDLVLRTDANKVVDEVAVFFALFVLPLFDAEDGWAWKRALLLARKCNYFTLFVQSYRQEIAESIEFALLRYGSVRCDVKTWV